MPRVSPDYVPAYRLHKSSGQGIVTLSGKDFLLGAFGSSESRAQYHTLIADWIRGGRKPLTAKPVTSSVIVDPKLTVADLVKAYTAHVEATYRDAEGNPQKASIVHIKRCCSFAADLFGSVAVDAFTPPAAIECRERMVKAGWTRRGCNRGLRVIRSMFRWGTAREMVNPATLQKLQAIEWLKPGRTAAPESDRVRAVPDAWVDAIAPHVAPPVWGLIQLQRLCGARGGELVKLRAVDIDTSGDVWIYRPARHKTQHAGHDRVLYFGPKAQDVLRPFMAGRPIDAYLFNPREGNEARMKARAITGKGRRPNQKPNPKKTERRIGDHYTACTYRKAIERGCELAEIDVWTPHQLRHSAATTWRRLFGPDVALTLLGDKTSNLVEVYAERDHQTAIRVAAEIG